MSAKEKIQGVGAAWIGPILLIVSVTIASTVFSFRSPLNISGDQRYIGVKVYAQILDDNYNRDVVFNVPDNAEYIPVYAWSMKLLTQATGTYEQALAWMMLPTTLFFLLGMTLLLYRLTGNRWMSVLVALLATMPHDGPMKGHWGPMLNVVAGSQARSLYLAFLPFMALALLDYLDQDKPRRPAWQLGLIGLGFGLITNLHPVSGYGMGLVVGGLIVLAFFRKDISLAHVGIFIAGLLIGVLPFLVYYLRNTATAYAGGTYDFQVYYNVVFHRVARVIPWRIWTSRGILSIWLPERISFTWVVIGIVVHAVLSITTGIGFWQSRRQGKDPAVRQRYLWAFALVQTAVIALLFVDQIWPGVLLIAYFVDVTLYREFDTHDRRLYEMIAGCYALFALTILIQVVWIVFEVDALGYWGAFLIRATRFAYLPIFAFVARFFTRLLRREGWIVAGATLLLLTMDSAILHLLMGGLLLVLSIHWPQKADRPPCVQAVIYGLAAAIYVERLTSYVQLEYAILTYLLTFYIVTVYFWVTRQWPSLRRRWVSVLTATVWVGLVLLVPLKRYGNGDRPGTLAVLLPRLAGQVLHEDFSMNRWPYLEEEFAREYELTEWARTETPTDALFMLRDGSNFRYYAQRSVTHTEKDLSSRAFSMGGAWVIDYARYLFEMQTSFREVNTLIDRAREVQADYVVVEKDRTQTRLDWPVVFENEAYLVYQVIY